MALFTNKADQRGVALLTQFYQLGKPGNLEQEIRQWLYQVSKESVAATYEGLEPEMGYTHFLAFLRIDQEEEEDVEHLLKIHSCLCALMECAADRVPHREENLAEMNRWIELVHPKPRKFIWEHNDATKEKAHDEVLLEPLWKSLGWALIQQFTKTLKMRQMGLRSYQFRDFARCIECKNVFLLTRMGQEFCSQRCRSTAGARRRYAIRFADYYPERHLKRGGKK